MDRVGMLVMADASTGEGARLLIEQAVERFGPIDILVHSVGGICHRDWDDYSETEWQAMLDLNLTSAWRCARVAKPFFSEGGAILFISSSSAFNLELDALPYSVAKAGLLTFTRGLASILAPAIRVNALAPGYVDTEFDLADMQNRERISSTIPAGRFARPEEVAHAALALLENDYITGQFLTVDGGESLINWGT